MFNSMIADRRQFLAGGAAVTLGVTLADRLAAAQSSMNVRLIPGTRESLPVVGLGAPDMFYIQPPEGRELPKSIIQAMVDAGGRVIDTPAFFRPDVPVIGSLLAEMKLDQKLFLTGKITVKGKEAGVAHLEKTVANLHKRPMDLLMVHNMLELENHWPTLKQWKADGKVRYIGVSRTRVTDFSELEKFMKAEKPDFLLIGYSITQQGPAERILPLAHDMGIAVIGAEPFKAVEDGEFFKAVAGKKLPEWAAEFDCETWAQFSLKYILSNPALTCVVTETSKVSHVLDNMHGGYGRFPNEATRKRMSQLLLSML